jgi:hypothetical protein
LLKIAPVAAPDAPDPRLSQEIAQAERPRPEVPGEDFCAFSGAVPETSGNGNLGLAQYRLGHFDETLATFREADRFDTPEVSL